MHSTDFFLVTHSFFFTLRYLLPVPVSIIYIYPLPIGARKFFNVNKYLFGKSCLLTNNSLFKKIKHLFKIQYFKYCMNTFQNCFLQYLLRIRRWLFTLYLLDFFFYLTIENYVLASYDVMQRIKYVGIGDDIFTVSCELGFTVVNDVTKS